MVANMFNMVLLLLVYLVGQIPTADSVSYCPFYRENHIGTYVKRCPDICCQHIRQPRENTTCCPFNVTSTLVNITVTYFNYNWWMIFLFAICSFTVLSIIVHFYKRFYLVKRMTVAPASAFTISKDIAAQNGVQNQNGMAEMESDPPSYSNATPSARPVSPPTYATINVAALA